jgi:hypothetical protein
VSRARPPQRDSAEARAARELAALLRLQDAAKRVVAAQIEGARAAVDLRPLLLVQGADGRLRAWELPAGFPRSAGSGLAEGRALAGLVRRVRGRALALVHFTDHLDASAPDHPLATWAHEARLPRPAALVYATDGAWRFACGAPLVLAPPAPSWLGHWRDEAAVAAAFAAVEEGLAPAA